MAGVGFDALMIRRADAGLKDKLGRLAYVAAGVGGVGRSAVGTRVEVDGETWFDGPTTCVLAGNLGDVLGGIAAFPQARPDDGRLDVGVVTADGALDWARTLSRTIVGDPASSPFVEVTTARRLLVSLDEALPYELDGEARPETRTLEFGVEPAAITVCVPPREDQHMSTANLVPETWEVTGDDARETLARTGRKRLIADAFRRLRSADGFSHARSLAFLGILLFVEVVIAVIGISEGLASARFSRAASESLQWVLPGPAGSVLEHAADQAHRAASSGNWLAIVFGTVAALITGTTVMGQIERAMNRIYGIETDRPSVRKYLHAFLVAMTGGLLTLLALVALGLGGTLARAFQAGGALTIWSIVRWPLGVALLIVAVGLILKMAPRRHQPAWSWMAFAAILTVGLLVVATVLLNVFFAVSGTFGSTYGPLAGSSRSRSGPTPHPWRCSSGRLSQRNWRRSAPARRPLAARPRPSIRNRTRYAAGRIAMRPREEE